MSERVIAMGCTMTGEHWNISGSAGMVLRRYGMRNCDIFGHLKDLFDPLNHDPLEGAGGALGASGVCEQGLAGHLGHKLDKCGSLGAAPGGTT